MYIHEREDWTNFVWDNERLAPVLAAVRHLQGRLLGRMESLGFELIERATLESLILDVVDTSRIEGEFLNSELVRSSIARKLGIENAEFVKTPRNIEGIVDLRPHESLGNKTPEQYTELNKHAYYSVVAA